MELFTGLGLATASGLNAYIPLLAMGLLGRFTNLVELPHPWAWLTNGWVIGIVAVLLVVEMYLMVRFAKQGPGSLGTGRYDNEVAHQPRTQA